MLHKRNFAHTSESKKSADLVLSVQVASPNSSQGVQSYISRISHHTFLRRKGTLPPCSSTPIGNTYWSQSMLTAHEGIHYLWASKLKHWATKTLGLPRWLLGGKEFACQCQRCGFDPWVGRIPWKRKWQPTPVFLLGKSPGQRSLVGYSPWGSQRVRYDWVTKPQHAPPPSQCLVHSRCTITLFSEWLLYLTQELPVSWKFALIHPSASFKS